MSADGGATRYVAGGTLRLVGFAAIAAAIVAGAWQLTGERIEANRHAARLAQFAPVLTGAEYDDIDYQRPQVIQPPHSLPGKRAAHIYRARSGAELVALVFDVHANGYNGPIELLIGIDTAGTVTGVRVVQHSETPGLGDDIEIGKSDWITTFAGRSFDNTPAPQWKLEQRGGDFEQFTGASVTPRGVVRAVRETLEYFTTNRADLLGGDAGATAGGAG
jgi:electron transport complex protein RnfG